MCSQVFLFFVPGEMLRQPAPVILYCIIRHNSKCCRHFPKPNFELTKEPHTPDIRTFMLGRVKQCSTFHKGFQKTKIKIYSLCFALVRSVFMASFLRLYENITQSHKQQESLVMWTFHFGIKKNYIFCHWPFIYCHHRFTCNYIKTFFGLLLWVIQWSYSCEMVLT